MINKLLEADHRVSEKIQLKGSQKMLRALAAFFAHSGDSWFWVAGLFLIWLFTRGDWHKFSALLAGAIVIQATLVIAIKFLIKRRRPEGQWGEIYRKTDPNSFPSGHAVRAVMLAALAWGFQLSPLNWILTLWAPLSFSQSLLAFIIWLTSWRVGCWEFSLRFSFSNLHLSSSTCFLLRFRFFGCPNENT